MRPETFAFHIQQICLEPVGSTFTLWNQMYLSIRISIKNEGDIAFAVWQDGHGQSQWVGNRQGAVQKYAELVGHLIAEEKQPA